MVAADAYSEDPPAENQFDNELLRKHAPDLMRTFGGVPAAVPTVAARAEFLKTNPGFERVRLPDGKDYYILPADEADALFEAIDANPGNAH